MRGRVGHQTLADETAALAEEVTELGILAVDVFKTAAAMLFAPDPDVAHAAVRLAAQSAICYQDVHQRAVALLARWSPFGEELRRVVDLQRTATECARIAEHGERIAERALALPAGAEEALTLIDARAASMLVGLIRQVWVLLRGCLLLIATRDRAVARRLVVEDAELERLYQQLKGLIERGITTRPRQAPPLHSLLNVLAELEEIGNRVTTLCRDRLTPPR